MFAVASILHEKVILLNSLSYLWMGKCKAVNNASGSQMDSEYYPSPTPKKPHTQNPE